MPILAQAADAPPFGILLAQALAESPAFLEQQADVGAALADAAQAKAWPNPRLDTLVENLGAPQSGGQSQRQSTYSLTQPLEILGQRAARVQVSERQLGVAEARRYQAKVDFAADLAIAHATVEAMLARKALAQDDLKRAQEDLRAARAQVQAGREADIRQAQASASVAASQAAAIAADADTSQALNRLSMLAGASTPYTGVSERLLAVVRPAVNPVQGESLAVATARAEREALEAQVTVEQKKWLPDINVSAGVRRYAWSSQSGYVLGVSASIPLFDQNVNGVAAARQRIAAAEARLAAAVLQADATRRSAQAQVGAAEQRLLAATEGEQAASEAYRLGRIGYESGKTSLMELLAIRRALSESKGLTIDAQLARVRALSALAQADGKPAFGDEK
ncbi:TolC family protein [Aquabacterium commune]|nr:TolC family protein [Aquabacterium commune]